MRRSCLSIQLYVHIFQLDNSCTAFDKIWCEHYAAESPLLAHSFNFLLSVTLGKNNVAESGTFEEEVTLAPLAIQISYMQKKLKEKCWTAFKGFKDNFEVIRCHINICRDDYQRTWKKEVWNVLGLAWSIAFLGSYASIGLASVCLACLAIATIDLWAAEGTNKPRELQSLAYPKRGDVVLSSR